jgi:hypothetical protein
MSLAVSITIRGIIAAMDAHDLYGLPLDRFIPERGTLAKELRKSGQREQADAVAALRKPSLAAWAVNQLVRTQGRAVAELFDAGDAVRGAQTKLLAGQGRGDALREALGRERQAVGKLVDVARGLLNSDGHELSAPTLERVAETLEAAALDEASRAQVRDGCLHRELRRVGLGAGEADNVPSPRRRAPRRGSEDRGALRKLEAEARRTAERAAREREAAQAGRDAAAEGLEAAEASLTAATKRAREAEAAHRRARDELQAER